MQLEANGGQIERALRAAAERLAAKGLMRPGDMLSQRVPERGAVLAVEYSADGAGLQAPRWSLLEIGSRDLHQAIYRKRPDVGAILEGTQPWAAKIALLGRSMPAIFDEQVRHLGRTVELSASPAGKVAPDCGANALVRDGRVICAGMGLERLLLNAELLEKCAQAFVLASATGGRVRTIPWWVSLIAHRRLLRDEHEAATLHLRGERSIMKTGYV